MSHRRSAVFTGYNSKLCTAGILCCDVMGYLTQSLLDTHMLTGVHTLPTSTVHQPAQVLHAHRTSLLQALTDRQMNTHMD